MKSITTETAYNKALNEVYKLMGKGEANLTDKDAKDITAMAKAIQEYEKIHHPFPLPKTITEIVELKMYKKKLNRVTLSKKLGIANSKLSQILNGKFFPLPPLTWTALRGLPKEISSIRYIKPNGVPVTVIGDIDKDLQQGTTFKDISEVEEILKDAPNVETKISLLKKIQLSNSRLKQVPLVGVNSKQDDRATAWINNKLRYYEMLKQSEVIPAPDKGKQPKNNEPEYKNLKGIFVSESTYDNIITLLSDNDFVDKDSGKWINKSRGYKSIIIALLQDLGIKGYYKEGVPSILDAESVKAIAENTFAVKISIDTIKGANREGNNIHELKRSNFSFIKTYQPK